MGAGIRTQFAVEVPCGNLVSSGAPSDTAGSTVGRRRVRAAVVPGTENDHFVLRKFLAEVFGAGYLPKFQSSLENPHYAPRDRLLLRRSGRIVAHVHVARRNMQFGTLSLPVGVLDGLATDEDSRGEGFGMHVLTAAERHMLRSGAVIGLLRTRIPHFFRRTGWALCGSNFRGAANPHTILARLLEEGLGRRRAPRMEGLAIRRVARIQVRPWRRWEEDAIARIYRQNLPGSCGLLERSRDYWHWLLERPASGCPAYHHFYVALDGPDLWDLKESSTQVVGYAAIRGERIVELATVPGRKQVVMELLARACRDAIEQGQRQVVLHAAADSPATEFFGGCQQAPSFMQDDQAEVCMARLLDPLGLLRKLCGVFVRRATDAGLDRPVELGLLVDGRKFQIEIAGCGRATADILGRSYLRLNVADFTRLVLGQLDWDRAVAEGRVEASTALAHDAARVLFPCLPYWRPLLDELLA